MINEKTLFISILTLILCSMLVIGQSNDDSLTVRTINKTNTTNPKYINLTYPMVWDRGTSVEMIVQVFNQEDKLYSPREILFETTKGILLNSTVDTEENAKIITFIVSKSIMLGSNSIEIIIKDDRILKENIEFKIGDSADVITEKDDYKELMTIFIIFIVIVIIGLISIVVALAIEGHKITKSQNNRNI